MESPLDGSPECSRPPAAEAAGSVLVERWIQVVARLWEQESPALLGRSREQWKKAIH